MTIFASNRRDLVISAKNDHFLINFDQKLKKHGLYDPNFPPIGRSLRCFFIEFLCLKSGGKSTCKSGSEIFTKITTRSLVRDSSFPFCPKKAWAKPVKSNLTFLQVKKLIKISPNGQNDQPWLRLSHFSRLAWNFTIKFHPKRPKWPSMSHNWPFWPFDP